MATKSLTFDLFGRDVSASKSMRGVGNNAQVMGDKFRRVGQVIGVGIAAVGVAAVKFGIDSVKAYSEAAEKQNELAFAFKKFPALADTNQKALQKLNSELQNKTRFDDDDLAGAQAVLAQYKLTGAQVTKLTPLLADYAQKTGKDLPSAATDFGKAMLGQGRGLKAIGVNFKDTGTAAGNFAELVDQVGGKVGGFAEQAGGTAAGKLAILQHKFGDLQEDVGQKLMPVLTGLVDFATDHLMPTLSDLGNSKGIDDFFGNIEKHSKGGDTFGFLDPSAWQHGADQWIDFVNNGDADPTKTGGVLDPGPWQNGFNQIAEMFRSTTVNLSTSQSAWAQSFAAQQNLAVNSWAVGLGVGLTQMETQYATHWSIMAAIHASEAQKFTAQQNIDQNGWAVGLGVGWAHMQADYSAWWSTMAATQLGGAQSFGAQQNVSQNSWAVSAAAGWAKMSSDYSTWWSGMGMKAQAGWSVLSAKAQAGGADLLAKFRIALNTILSANGAFWANLGAKFATGWSQIQNFFFFHPFQVQAKVVWTNTTPPISPNGGGVRPMTAFATGGIVRARPGGTNALIGEAGTDEAVVPLTPRNLAAIGGGGSGVNIYLTVNGFVAGSADDAAKGLHSLMLNAQKRGAIPKGVALT